MKRDKEQALNDYSEMIKKSWTFARLTTKEQDSFIDLIYSGRIHLKGDYLARWEQLQGVYGGFLAALDYFNNTCDWRATSEELENNPRF